MCQMCNPEDIARFVAAGHAILTLKSEKSGIHYTYCVNAAEDHDHRWFVKLLTAPDTYTYVGMLSGTPPIFTRTKASKLGYEAPAMKAWGYFVQHVLQRRQLPPQLQVFHEGRCGRCGRPLTVPESIERGIGPDCWKLMGLGQ